MAITRPGRSEPPALAVVGRAARRAWSGRPVAAELEVDPRPARRATSPIAAEMSPSRPPGRAFAMPASRARPVTSMSSRSSGRAVPTTTLRAESATQPSTLAAVHAEQVAVLQDVVVREPVQDRVVD